MTASRGLGVAIVMSFAAAHLRAQSPGVPSYRARILGVFNVQSGEPIEGAEVVDVMSHTSALTTKTGTVSLVFLPDTGSLVRIQKIGYSPATIMVAISPVDTVPITVLLNPIAQTLPTVVTKDSSPHFISPGLRAFEERRKSGAGGRFITEAELRKSDNRRMTEVMRSVGVYVKCVQTSCYAVSSRQAGGIHGGDCPLEIYLDGMRVPAAYRDLERMQVPQYAGIEIYFGAATIPTQYNMTGSACGIILMWTRER